MLQSKIKQEPLDRQVIAPLFAMGMGAAAWYIAGTYFSAALPGLPEVANWLIYIGLSVYEWYYVPKRGHTLWQTIGWLVVVGADIGAAYVGLLRSFQSVNMPFFVWKIEISGENTNYFLLVLAIFLAFAPEPFVRGGFGELRDNIRNMVGTKKKEKANG